MIRYLLFRRRIDLKLLILSLFISPIISVAQEGSKLELPKVVIYGTYLGKMQLGPKKDFFTYLSQGNLFPLSRSSSPELCLPSYRESQEEVQRIDNYWVFLDAGGGNFWSDKVFLDCGLKNRTGFLSLGFQDFRRAGWEKDYSKSNELVHLKGVLKNEKYYLSGKIFYGYNKDITGTDSIEDKFVTENLGMELLSNFNFEHSSASLSGFLSHTRYLDRMLGGLGFGQCATVTENLYGFSAEHNTLEYNSPLGNIDIKGRMSLEGAAKNMQNTGWNDSETITSLNISVRKTFQGIATFSPGLRAFLGKGGFSVSPFFSLRAVIPGFELYPFVTYTERRNINTLKVFDVKSPYWVMDTNNYTICTGKSIMSGVKGRWQRLSYTLSYNHIEYQNYPICYMTTIKARKDILASNINLTLIDLSFTLSGEYTPREKIRYEPVSKFEGKLSYKGTPPYILFAGFNSEFAIETYNDTIDIFLLNAGIERTILDNLGLSLEVNNIFDSRYERWQGYTEGGIQFYLSVKYKILK